MNHVATVCNWRDTEQKGARGARTHRALRVERGGEGGGDAAGLTLVPPCLQRLDSSRTLQLRASQPLSDAVSAS